MKKNNTTAAKDMIDLIRDLVIAELAKKDTTAVCKIISENKDGSYNVTVYPDDITLIKNVKSITPENLSVGEYAYLYKFQNQLNNAIIISKIGGQADDFKFVELEKLEDGVYSNIINESNGDSGTGGSDFPTISVTSLRTNGNFEDGSTAYLNVKVLSGTVQPGDELVIAARKNSKRSGSNKRKRRYKALTKVVLGVATGEMLSIPIDFDQEVVYKGIKACNPNCQLGPVTRYVFLRRVDANRSKAVRSNIVTIQMVYSPTYDKLGLY